MEKTPHFPWKTYEERDRYLFVWESVIFSTTQDPGPVLTDLPSEDSRLRVTGNSVTDRFTEFRRTPSFDRRNGVSFVLSVPVGDLTFWTVIRTLYDVLLKPEYGTGIIHELFTGVDQ